MTAKIQDLEQVAAQPEFWENQNVAQAAMQELNDYKSHLAQFQQWQSSVSDAQTALELMEMEPDEALGQEAKQNLSQVSTELDRWE